MPRATVLKNQKLAPTVHELSLKIEDAWTFHAGQFVTLPVPRRPEDTKDPKGFFSVASAETRLPEIDLLVEHRPDGGYVSGWIAALQPGAQVEIQGPQGHFKLEETESKGQVFLGTRAGLAPLRSLLYSSLAQKTGKHHWLVLGATGASELLLDAEWRALEKANEHFHYLPVIRPTAENPFQGKNQDPADAVIQKFAQRTGLRLYMAGFSADLDPMKVKLLEAGFSKDDLKMEKFG
jgi:CDP-4-dehydro-6-deoxyglucose reductase